MRCEQFRELISAYIEQSIAPPLAAKMDEHAARCGSCRTELEDVRRLWQMMTEAKRVEPPASLHARIMQEVYANTPAVPALRWWELAWRPRFAFAAAAVLMVLALVIWSRNTHTDAIALSVVSSGGNPVSPVPISNLPVRFEPFLTDDGSLRWMLKMNAPRPTSVEVTAGAQSVWSGTVAQETATVLPAMSQGAVLEVRVVWDGSITLRAWLPAEISQEEHKPVLVLKERSIEQTLGHITRAYGVPLVLVGETDPLTRVNLESTGVTLDEMLSKLGEKLNLQVSRAEDGTTILTAR
ncbi:MAG: zf-HC2 domain-containing protein [bacterium]|nr:zf-HC2 domain-containing protein [bacterium]